jgi:hypothetical protein
MHDPERRNKAITRLLKKVKKDGKTPVVTVGQEDPEAQNLLTA